MENRLVFLTYIQRSGSTLLARLLSEYEGVGCTLANDFPDGLLLPGIRLRTSDDIDHVVSALYASTKFDAWKVGRDQLTNALERAHLPMDFPALLNIIHGLYFRGQEMRLTIHKRGAYILHLETLHRLFPRSRVIFLQRDPRAVFVSLKKAIHSATGAPMLTDPVALARYFNRTLRIIAQYGDNSNDLRMEGNKTGTNRTIQPVEGNPGFRWFLPVRYEDLVSQSAWVLETILHFTGFPDLPRRETSTYADSIHADQKHLHARVASPPMADRVDAWRDEIEGADLYILQKIAGRAMVEAGYRPIPVRARPFALVLALARHLWRKQDARSISPGTKPG